MDIIQVILGAAWITIILFGRTVRMIIGAGITLPLICIIMDFILITLMGDIGADMDIHGIVITTMIGITKTATRISRQEAVNAKAVP